MEKNKFCLNCADCSVQNCEDQESQYPAFCPTLKITQEELDELNAIYSGDSIDGQLARTSAHIEAEYYCKKTRVEETVLYIQRMGFKKVGIAVCVGLINEGKTFAKILRKNGIECYMVVCKVGSQDKCHMGFSDEEKIPGCSFDPMCNPILQARVLNREKTELNVVIGLCVGHDSLFYKHSDAPVTTLVAKDRVLAHNPVGALYSGYYRKLYE